MFSRLALVALMSGTLLSVTADEPNHFFDFKQVATLSVGKRPLIFGNDRDSVLVFDTTAKHVYLLGQDGKERSFGDFGTAPGQFYEPTAIASNGTVMADVEPSSQRIQWFSADGKFLQSCHLDSQWDTLSAAMTPEGQLVINDSHSSHPIIVLDQNCHSLREFGNRVTVSELYHTTNTTRDESYKDASNRVFLTADEGSIVSAYFTAPVVVKYDSHGKELFRINLDHAVDKTFWAYSPSIGGMSTGLDGVQVPYITRGVSVDPSSHHIYVLATRNLHGDDALYDIAPDGSTKLTFPIHTPNGGDLYSMAVLNRRLYVCLVFANGLYVSPLPGGVSPNPMK